MLSLNIQMQSFELAKNIVHDDDTIRVSVTSLPGEQKQAFSFDANKMKTAHPFFTIKINEKTEKILIVIRKKSFSQKDPIVASAIIKKGQFPTKFEDISNTRMSAIDLLEPLQHCGKKSPSSRKIVGKIDIQFSLTQEMSSKNTTFKAKISKKKNGQGYAKMDSFFNDENGFDNSLLVTN